MATGFGGFQAFPAPAKGRSEILQGPGLRNGSGITWGRLIDNILLEGLMQGCITGSPSYTGRVSVLPWLANMTIGSGWVT